MENNTNFESLVQSVDSNKILLPDFQRDFVWKDEDQQKSIVASVLAKMPIGSILLLESDPKEYACKRIGSNSSVDTQSIPGKVRFLLDGQQRITVLTNVFSNVIQRNAKKVSDLISPSLKRRFFLVIPKWANVYSRPDTPDLFGVRKLEFPMTYPDTEIPDFLSGDIKDFIECKSFKANDKNPYSPFAVLSTDLDNYCLGQEDGYYIPLYLAIATGKREINSERLRFSTIVDSIGLRITQEIETFFVECNEETKKGLLQGFSLDDEMVDECMNDFKALHDRLAEHAQNWRESLKKYFDGCLKNLELNQVVVLQQDRKRAIDIYENMNRGGVSLNTFDLIMARVATVSTHRFMDRIIASINGPKDYPLDVAPDSTRSLVNVKVKAGAYNASVATRCCEKETELTKVYIDSFLDVMSLYCNNPAYSPDKYNIRFIKKDEILKLDPEDINVNTEKVCTAIDRSMYFFQTRCGIKNIKDINNALTIVVVATIFTNDKWFADSTVHELLESWYWSSLFSGEYDRDQNATMIRHLTNMVKTVQGKMDKKWISAMKDRVLAQPNFSDKDLLLMRKVQTEERTPKSNLQDFVLQFYLAKTYPDLFDDNEVISVFCKDVNSLEAHHIIPLGATKTYGESSTKLKRNNPTNICNSPVNFVFITKSENLAISDKSLGEYVKSITDSAKSALHISGYKANADPETILDARFDAVRGDVIERITNLLVSSSQN